MDIQLPLHTVFWATLCSVIILLLHGVLLKFNRRKKNDRAKLNHTEILVRVRVETEIDSGNGIHRTYIENPIERPQKRLYVFEALRLSCCLTIFALQVSELVLQSPLSKRQDLSSGIEPLEVTYGPQLSEGIMLCSVFGYTSVLSLFAFLHGRSWSLAFSVPSLVLKRHINATLFVALVVYAVRDIYPLVTYSMQPLDLVQSSIIGRLLWTKIALLFVTAVVIPLVNPRTWNPVDLTDSVDAYIDNPQAPNPEQTASPLSLMLFTFLDGIVWKAYRVAHLPAAELPPLADSDHVRWLKKLWFPYLEEYSSAFDSSTGIASETPKSPRAMAWTLAWMFRWTWIEMAVALVGQTCGNLGSPIAVNRLLAYLENGISETSIRPWFWIILLFISPLAVTLSFEWYYRLALWLNVQVEALLTQLIFEHALRIRVKSNPSNAQAALNLNDKNTKSNPSKSKAKSQTSRINNLVTTDLSNIAELRNWMSIFFQRPLEFVLSVVFLSKILGWWSTFVGIGLMILLAPIPAKIINKGRKLFLERMRKMDLRVEVFGDVMSVLRMVKLFGWEAKMSERIGEARWEELRVLRQRKVFLMFSDLVNYIVPLTLILKQNLTPSRVFASLVLFEKLQQSIKFMFVNLNRYYTGLISIQRYAEFLGETELIDVFDSTSPLRVGTATSSATTLVMPTTEEDTELIGFQDATFSWNKTDVETLTEELSETSQAPAQARKFFLRVSDRVLFQHGRINLIIGPTGSGKTAMLLALLGEMHFIPSSSSQDSWFHLPRVNGVAYAAQESWVLNETIRDNILFHSPFDQERYNKVLYQCALERDLLLFDTGDSTEVGEKGLTLSGGQKARLTLARAVYSDAKVLLLDDVLAALDVHTSKWIVEKCFMGDLMHGRTVILVTHNTALNLPIASFVVTLKDGRVVSQESIQIAPAALVEAEAQPTEDLAKRGERAGIDSDELTSEGKPSNARKDLTSSGKLVMEEEVQVGHVSWSAIKLYATGIGGKFPILFFVAWIGTNVIAQLTVVFQTWYLGFWASQYEGRNPGDVPVVLYLAGYAAVVISTVIINCLTAINYLYGTIRASDYIHKHLVVSILGTTMRWLDKTPISRIITRSTQDINSVDVAIAQSVRDFVDVSFRLLSRLGAVVLFSPIFLVPGFLLLIIGICCGSVYFKAQMSVKREMSVAKAPVLGHFGATIAGLTSIRAYGVQKLAINEMQTRTDRHSRIARVFNNLQRWMAVRINILSAVFTASLAWYLVYVLHQSASVTGFSLNMAVSFSGAIFSFILQFNALEARSNSLERIENYLNIEQEPKPERSGIPPAYWPASGELRVENLSARYSPDSPEVLHNVSFHIKAGERIGVVGRTGSGKSSLVLSLLRCIYTSGEIFYDELSLNKVNLDALRSCITIIPQIPELISGSLRENLDPFQEHDDLTLNEALKSAGLHSLQEDLPAKDRITLDTMISSGGTNFSLGQRQIIALARAYLRQSKLLILDEATSAIDYKTDSIIQSSLRNQLNVNVTLITIAHRLQTIMNADRIMVLDSGSIVEFDTPIALLQIPEGYLRALVDQSHDKEILVNMATNLK